MCSVISHQSSAKTTANISCKVKRRLFQDEEEKKNGFFARSDDADIISLESEGSPLVVLKGGGAVSSTKSIVNQILIITTFEESTSMQLLSDQAMCTINNINVLHCLPEHAFRQCEQSRYNIIFTDIDLASNCEIIRLIITLRKNSALNNNTPIIALHQSLEKNAESLTFYGVTNVFRGEVDLEQIKDIFELYKNVFNNESNEFTTFIDNKSLNESLKVESSSASSLQSVCDSTSEPSVIILNRTDHIDERDIISSTSSKGQFTANTVIPSNDKKESAPTCTADSFTTPVHCTDGPVLNSASFIETIRPAVRLANQRSKTFHGKVAINGVPPFPLHVRRFPFNIGNQMNNGSAEVPYMISGVPGSSDMKLTLLPDDASKHSTKERLRREKIKDCVEKLRNLLPKPIGCSKKLDMATVLDMTVRYLNIYQTHASPVLNEQCSQVFQSNFQQMAGKRALQNEEKESTGKSKTKVVKKELSDKYSNNSPKRSMIFQPPSNMCHRYRTFGNATMATMATIFPPPHDGLMQSPFPQQLGSHGNSMAVSHTRPVVPYQGVEYFNMLLPNTYENMAHAPLGQPTRPVPTMKDTLFSDAPMPISSDYSQSQHLTFYNHH